MYMWNRVYMCNRVYRCNHVYRCNLVYMCNLLYRCNLVYRCKVVIVMTNLALYITLEDSWNSSGVIYSEGVARNVLVGTKAVL